MATHRRQFIKTAGIFGFSLGIPALSKNVIASTAARVFKRAADEGGTDIYKKATFLPHLNSMFRVQAGASSVDVQLVDVTDLKATSKNPKHIRGSENFSLMFKATGAAPRLGDNVYELQHAALGAVPLFLVGVGRPGGVRSYEAVVRRL
ncbi:MAG TPA: hypothetical protein VJT50_08715 [Pyrinomonadaceae bacterium]|nr:hypothetical protein [Pyrinomonadaceae bacterium]